VGANRGDIEEFLETEYEAGMDLDGGIDLALEALAQGNDEDLEPSGVGLGTVDVESESYRKHETEEIAGYLDELDLQGGDEE
jgi:proteasome alpha subunit